MMIKISVVIPIYNVEEYIEECLCSVLKQTLQDIEIICVNDGTEDNSMSIVEKYKTDDDRIVIVNKENGGLSSARNAGIEQAKGEYIYFLDSDDLIAENMLAILYEEAKKDDLDNIYFDAEAFYESPEVEQQHPHYKTYYCRPGMYTQVQSGIQLFTRMELFKDYRPSACLQMPKLSLLMENNLRFKEGIIHEDQLFSFQAIVLAKKAKHIPEPFYKRRVRNESIMTSEKEFRSSYSYYICLMEAKQFIKQFDFQDEQIVKAITRRLRILQGLSLEKLQNLSEEDMRRQLQKYPFEHKLEYELMIKRIAEERLEQKGKREVLVEKTKAIKNSSTFKLGAAIVWLPRKAGSFIRTISNKGIACTMYGIQRKLRKEERKLAPEGVCVSVIIPMYNAEKYLRKCLNQLCNQTLQAIEIICVNDGSTDATWDILEEYVRKDKRIQAIYQENQGAGIARNTGIEAARGEYLLFLDADDIFDKKLCEQAYYKAKYDMADIVLFEAERLNMQTAEKEDMSWVLKEKLLPKKMPFSAKHCGDKLYQITSACPWSKMFRAEFVKQQQLQFQNTKNANDVFFVRTALATAKRITVLKKKLITYRYNEGSSIQSKKNEAPIEFYKAFKALKQELIRKGVFKTVERSYVNMVLKESLFNLKTVDTDEAKQLIKKTLWEEGFSFFELSKYDESYFYEKKEYKEYKELLEEKEAES